MKNTKTNLVSVIVAAIALAMAGVAAAKDELPDQTTDGLNRIESKNAQAVYWQDGATLEPYTKVMEEGGYAVVQKAGRSRSYAASAGQMTLYLELYDSATSSKIGLVLDSQAARDTGMMHVSNSVTNRSEAGRMLGRWSSLLVAAMDEAKNQGE